MPFTLPATSTRRQFLQRSGLGALAASTIPSALAEERTEIWHLLSDPHIDADSATTNKNNTMATNLDKVVAAVLTEQQARRSFGLIINGDLAFDSGLPGDYNNLVAHLKPLRDAGIDVHVTLGNHDNRDNFKNGCLDLLALRKSPLDHHYTGIIESALVNWVLIDTLEETDSTPGLVGDRQLGWLDRTLRDLPNKPTIVVSHHDLQGPVEPGKRVTGLKDTEALIKVLESHSKVQVFIYGHTHRWEVSTKKSGLHLINLPAIGYPHNPAQPIGHVTATVTSKAFIIKLSALDPAHPAHGQEHMLELA